MTPMRALVGAAAVAALAVGAGRPSQAAPEQAGAVLEVMPGVTTSGDYVRLAVSGLAGAPLAGTTACVGFLGPDQNLELGLSPRFQVRLGTVVISIRRERHGGRTCSVDGDGRHLTA